MPLFKAKQIDIQDATNAILNLIASDPTTNNTFSNLVNSVNTFVTTPQLNGPVKDIVVSSITATSALVTWTAIAGAVSYNIEYNIKGDGIEILTVTGVTSPYTLTGLTAGTTYEINVRPTF